MVPSAETEGSGILHSRKCPRPCRRLVFQGILTILSFRPEMIGKYEATVHCFHITADAGAADGRGAIGLYFRTLFFGRRAFPQLHLRYPSGQDRLHMAVYLLMIDFIKRLSKNIIFHLLYLIRSQ